MMRVLGYRPPASVIVAVGVLSLAAAGIAFATIPDSSGVIHGCYKKLNGTLRVVDSPGDCRHSEAAIQWNQRGPQGPPGPPGISGYQLVDRTFETPLPINGFFQAFCPGGTRVFGGGARVELLNASGDSAGFGSPVQSSIPLSGGGGWEVHVNQPVVGGATRARVLFHATCANVAP
jgi:hypothetical protein